jgi:hypothetical protein
MEECPVCLVPLSGSITTVGCCKKQFHTECLLKCTTQKNECPMCRSVQVIQGQAVVVPVPVLSYDEEVYVTRQKMIAYWMFGIAGIASTVILLKMY